MGVKIKKKLSDDVPKELAPYKDQWKPYERIVNLGKVHEEYVAAQLLKGVPPRIVARDIRDRWGMWLDQSLDAVTDTLKNYRDKLLLPSINARVMAASKNQISAALEKFDTMNEFVDLLLIQKDRVMKLYAQEQKGPLLMGTVTSEIAQMANMVRHLAMLQMEMGILRRAPKTLSMDLTAENPDGTKGKMSIHWTDAMTQEYEDACETHGVFGEEIEATTADTD